ncbi:DUF2274 domain-containing protein [Nguyenibacter vanlangensis]|uniref:DUF2274 domain-containing protein n=1 Tax=Nguyenibacter vanlangensis TaxID=1216886 RepID=A0ABZ3DA47_9PROT
MATLKITRVMDEKPVKLTLELPAHVFRDLKAYADIIASSGSGGAQVDEAHLAVRMIQHFMQEDRVFQRERQRKPDC